MGFSFCKIGPYFRSYDGVGPKGGAPSPQVFGFAQRARWNLQARRSPPRACARLGRRGRDCIRLRNFKKKMVAGWPLRDLSSIYFLVPQVFLLFFKFVFFFCCCALLDHMYMVIWQEKK